MYNTAYLLRMKVTLQINIQINIIQIVECLITSMCNLGVVYISSVGIPMGTNCAPMVTNFFWYSYDIDFVHLQKSKLKKENK